MDNGNLKRRHLHWNIFAANLPENDPIVKVSVIAEDENSAIELAKSIVVRNLYRVDNVYECFTPHDTTSEMLEVSEKNFQRLLEHLKGMHE